MSFINNAKKSIKENIKALSFASIIILIPLMLLIITKLNPKNADIRNINYLCKEIHKINLSLSSALDENSVNTDNAKTILPTVSKDLETAKKNLLIIEASPSSEKLVDSLRKSLDKNISLVNQALSMYMSPDSNSLDKKIIEFKDTLSLYLESLETLKIYNLEKTISDTSLKFFHNTYSYFETLVDLNILNDISQSSERDFLLKISDITSNFNLIKEDLQPAIINIKENNRDISTLLRDLDQKKNIFSKIEEEYYMLSFPDSTREISDSLEESINSYDSYMNSLSQALLDDIQTNNEEDAKKLYDSAFEKHNEFLRFYADLLSKIEDFTAN
ncbi:hypothetical protein [uncultured Clostridium sp.]|uniref:hypothetical protein n=1 Tax=uncultured Clostridium sp. TaxID=59620 RepID=UPI00261997FF|nr:hypothetical protein [uncultured Clostridium sp.]